MPILASPPPHFSSFSLREKMSLSDFEGLSEHELNTLHIDCKDLPNGPRDLWENHQFAGNCFWCLPGLTRGLPICKMSLMVSRRSRQHSFGFLNCKTESSSVSLMSTLEQVNTNQPSPPLFECFQGPKSYTRAFCHFILYLESLTHTKWLSYFPVSVLYSQTLKTYPKFTSRWFGAVFSQLHKGIGVR